MSAKTRQVAKREETIAHFCVLVGQAIELLNDQFNPRDQEQTKALIRAVQLYKDDMLGSVISKLTKDAHLYLFFDVLCGNSNRLPALIDSLREFGLGDETCKQLAMSQARPSLEGLWSMKLGDLQCLMGNDLSKVAQVQTAFLKLQKKVGIVKPLRFPGATREETRDLHAELSHIYYKSHAMDD